MKLGIFYSDLRGNHDMLFRLKGEKIGVFLVGNGIYHATIKEKGEPSPILQKKEIDYYVLSEDLSTRGFSTDEVDSDIKVITYSDLTDLIMNDYDKLAWL
ncbi:MAG: hypothetical protein HY999_04280 [Nitrospinae bacterium]|nr:hypothetical protein [Nitrospinota bacterium]